MMYFHDDRTPPLVTRWLHRTGRVLAVLVVSLMLLGAARAYAQPWGPAYHPSTYRTAVVPLPFFQVIHTASDLGAVDVYIDDHRFWDDAAPRTAAPFTPLMRGAHKIDVVAATDADNSNPIWTDTLSFRLKNNYALITLGTRADSTFDVLVLEELHLEAENPDQVEYALVHGTPDAPALDLRLLDPLQGNRVSALLVNNIAFGGFRGHAPLDPAGYNVEVTTANNAVLFDVFHLDFQARRGETFLFLITPGPADSTVSLLGVDVFGTGFSPAITTATDTRAAVPEALALRGNYPNPFNPATTIAFDLPETARVRVEVVDLLGRSVLAMPAQRLEAGAAQTLTVDASTLASGTYLYRVVAQTPTRTLTKTGRMVLMK